MGILRNESGKVASVLYGILLYGVAVFYLFLLLVILFRTSHPERALNLLPFHAIVDYMAGGSRVLQSFAFINLVGNIVIFVPLGVYLTMFSRSKTVCKNLLAVFVFSLIVEIIQYTFKLGIGDIDDIILNCLGGFIGIGIYQLLLRALRDTAKVRRIVAVAAPVVGVLSFLFLYLYNVR